LEFQGLHFFTYFSSQKAGKNRALMKGPDQMEQDCTIALDEPLERVSSKSASPEGRPAIMMSDFSKYLSSQEGGDQASSAQISDLSYERSEGVCDVLSAVRDRAPLVFVSGRAGTGKSRLIDYMKSLSDGGRQVVVAPTGVAALALKASTIHAFFKLPIGVIDITALAEEDVQFGPIMRRMSRLVIDEISMVRADILDGIDVRLRLARGDDRPFGGVQVVLVGDFLQLPPVVTDEDRALLECLGYETPFAFSSKVMRRTPIRVATLKKVWRQSDPKMIEALGDIREGRNISRAVTWLNKHCARDHRPESIPLLLTATRSAAEEYNRTGLDDLRSSAGHDQEQEVSFYARSGGTFSNEEAALPAPRILTLLPGTRVMSVKNDPGGAFVNGSLGVVVAANDGSGVLEDAFVIVKFDGTEKEVRITASDWSKSRQMWDDEKEAITETTTGFYQQIPLVFGYAITIHKSQGLTLEDVRIDLGRGAFAHGQLYVALSRARSVEGLSFVRPIEDRDVRVDEMLVRFLEWARSAENLDFGPVSS